MLTKEGHEATLSIPCHNKDMGRRLLANLIDHAGMDEDEYLDWFHKRRK
jgi:hypothetical protein